MIFIYDELYDNGESFMNKKKSYMNRENILTEGFFSNIIKKLVTKIKDEAIRRQVEKDPKVKSATKEAEVELKKAKSARKKADIAFEDFKKARTELEKFLSDISGEEVKLTPAEDFVENG